MNDVIGGFVVDPNEVPVVDSHQLSRILDYPHSGVMDVLDMFMCKSEELSKEYYCWRSMGDDPMWKMCVQSARDFVEWFAGSMKLYWQKELEPLLAAL